MNQLFCLRLQKEQQHRRDESLQVTHGAGAWAPVPVAGASTSGRIHFREEMSYLPSCVVTGSINGRIAMRERNDNAPVSKRMLKVVAFVLLAWCLGGPLIELVDRWDNLRAEAADIACSAGGRLTLLLMGASVALGLAQKLRQHCSNFTRNMQDKVLCLVLGGSIPPVIEISPAESPPPLLVPLRI